MKTYYHKFNTFLCNIILAGNEKGLTSLHLDTGEGKRGFFTIPDDWIEKRDFFSEAEEQILEYLRGDRKEFTVKINPDGTDFQKKVWSKLMNIPFGELVSYKDIASAIGNENASRAVGSANGKNPIPLIIPCHRVVASNGGLSGFAHGVKIKEQLIKIEREAFKKEAL